MGTGRDRTGQNGMGWDGMGLCNTEAMLTLFLAELCYLLYHSFSLPSFLNFPQSAPLPRSFPLFFLHPSFLFLTFLHSLNYLFQHFFSSYLIFILSQHHLFYNFFILHPSLKFPPRLICLSCSISSPFISISSFNFLNLLLLIYHHQYQETVGCLIVTHKGQPRVDLPTLHKYLGKYVHTRTCTAQ